MTGLQNQLVIKTTAANLAEVKALLAALDKPPANLLITVRNRLDQEIARDIATVSGAARAGDVTVSGGAPPPRSGATVGIRSNNASITAGASRSLSRRSANDSQRLRVLEGRQAFIQTGISAPVPGQTVTIRNGSVTTTRTTGFTEVGTGFYVRPSLLGSGDAVRLEISQHRDRLRTGSVSGGIATSSSSTVVTGELGRWLEIADTSRQSTSSRSSTGSTRSSSRTATQTVYVRVERLP